MTRKVRIAPSPGALSDFVWGMRRMSEVKSSQKALDLSIEIALAPSKISDLRYDEKKYQYFRTEYGSSSAMCQGMACALWVIEEERNEA